MPTLDERIAVAVLAVRRLERAFHDPGPWTFQVEGAAYPASREITPDAVVFRGVLPCSGQVELCCAGQTLACRPLPASDGDIDLEWALTLPALQVA